MKVDIIFTPEYRDQAVAGALAQGNPLPNGFRGPSFENAKNAGDSYVDGFFAVELECGTSYHYPKQHINRLRISP